MGATRMVLLAGMDDGLAEEIQAALEGNGYGMLRAESVQEMLLCLCRRRPDLVVLMGDRSTPIFDLWKACLLVKELSNLPLMVIVGLEEHADKLRSFELGTDDCLVRPVFLEEFMARVDALLRRFPPRLRESHFSSYSGGEVLINLETPEVYVRSQRVSLSRQEYQVLTELVRNAGQVVSHESLVRAMGEGEGMVDKGNLRLRACVYRLRRKIERDPSLPCLICTHWGEGYSFGQSISRAAIRRPLD